MGGNLRDGVAEWQHPPLALPKCQQQTAKQNRKRVLGGGVSAAGGSCSSVACSGACRARTAAAAAITLTLSNLPSLAAGAGLAGGMMDAAKDDIAVDALESV